MLIRSNYFIMPINITKIIPTTANNTARAGAKIHKSKNIPKAIMLTIYNNLKQSQISYPHS